MIFAFLNVAISAQALRFVRADHCSLRDGPKCIAHLLAQRALRSAPRGLGVDKAMPQRSLPTRLGLERLGVASMSWLLLELQAKGK